MKKAAFKTVFNTETKKSVAIKTSEIESVEPKEINEKGGGWTFEITLNNGKTLNIGMMITNKDDEIEKNQYNALQQAMSLLGLETEEIG